MKTNTLTLKNFINRHFRSISVMAGAMVAAMHGFLFSSNYRIDTLIKLVSQIDDFNDIELGRFGIVYLNKLLGMQWYNPYLVAFLTMAMLIVSGTLIAYTVWKTTGGRCAKIGFLLPFLVYLTPNWTEQLYFSYQTFLVVLGVVLVQLSVLMVVDWVQKMDHKKLFMASIMLFVAFSVYQSFVPLYIALGVACFLLECLTDERKDLSYFARSLVGYAVVGAIALVGYYLANKIANIGVEQTDYLSKQFLWGSLPLAGVVSNIIQSLRSILIAQGAADTLVYSLSLAASLAFLMLYLVKNKKRPMAGFLILAWAGLQFSAVALIFALGTRTYIRTELAITFVIAFNFLLCWLMATGSFPENTKPRRMWMGAACAVMLLGLAVNSGVTFRLYYTEDIRYEHDRALAERLSTDLQENTSANDGQKTVVFVGEPSIRLNEACLTSEVIGVSLFAYHDSAFATNTIISEYLLALGNNYEMPSDEDIQKAGELALDMTDYPAEGSILETEDLIVVRFSEDPYYGTDYMTPGYTESDLRADSFADTHLTTVDGISCADEVVTLQGFSVLYGTPANQLHYQVLLQDLTSDKTYAVNTSCAQRLKISKLYAQDGINYDSCGFIAKFPLELLNDEAGTTYEVVLLCTNDNGESYYLKTDIYINYSMLTKNPKVS